jgi:hypothetical protein
MTKFTKDVWTTLALNQLHIDLYRVYEAWLEVGNGDMGVLEIRMDDIRETFVRSTQGRLTDTEQTRLYVKTYEECFISLMKERNKV